VDCPAFQSEEPGHLPKEAEAPRHISRHRLYRLGGIALTLLLVLGIAALGWRFFGDQLSRLAFAPPQVTPHPAYVAPTYIYQQPTVDDYIPGIVPTKSPQPRPAVATLIVDSISNFDSTAIVQTVAASPTLIQHKIVDGDNLELLANKYNTTSQAIIDINFKMRVPVWVDHVIVIPEDIVDVSNLPKFEAQLIEETTAVSVIIDEADCSAALFQQYNYKKIITKEGVESILADTWVFIPRNSPSKQP
jgi:LysM repeat protein